MIEEASTYNGLKIVYSRGVGKMGQMACRKMKPDHFLTPHTRINSKWTKDLNVRLGIIKFQEENISSKILDIGHRNFLLDISPLARETEEKITNGISSS